MLKLKLVLATSLFLFTKGKIFSQCTTLGQTPSTAFPVCGTTTFHQASVPLCSTNALYVPGCSGVAGGPLYENRNPFFYRFTCYTAGTLGFTITPLLGFEDYDWQLYDITGQPPEAIFTNNSLVVTGNWSGSYGPTGASAAGINSIQCASDPAANAPTFAAMPNLVVGHVYLLMVSHYTSGQSGYDLSFTGGSASITDPLRPKMVKATPSCDGTQLTLTLNKKVLCNSLTPTGTEFTVAGTTVTAAAPDSCSFSFDFDELTISLGTPLTSGTHQLVINNGIDANSILDNCGHAITAGESVSFDYVVPQPIRADSIGRPTCAPDSIVVYYPKKIKCSTLSPAGTDFSVTGPTPVTITSVNGNCANDLTSYVVVHFSAPIYNRGTYTLQIQPGIDGSPVFDLCGQPILPQVLNFVTADTVLASINYTSKLGCQRDTLSFSHDGAHDVNSWNWTFNNGTPILTQNHTIVWPATSTNTVQLIVSNGTCRDTSSTTIVLDNEVKAVFYMPDIICPEDRLSVTDSSKGLIDNWYWTFDRISTSNVQNPAPVLFPTTNHEAYYTVKLKVTNNALHCSDSARHTLTVLDHCFIAVPTAFTPNGDGLNDTFWPHNALKADDLIFKVYNRWGQLVYQSKTWRDRWDGKINGSVQATGVYVWMLSYTHRDTKKPVFQKGTVLLIK